MHHPLNGPTAQIGPLLHFVGESDGTLAPAPLLGQHTRSVLAGLGYAEAAIAEPERRGVARASGPAVAPAG